MSHTCPICSKAGLLDYTKGEVVCPQCNSDLKAFLLLNSISESECSRPVKVAVAGLSLLVILFLGLLVKSNNDKDEILATNDVLNNSIASLKEQEVHTERPKEEPQLFESKEATVKYVVKKGDYLYKIAQFFYSDGSMYNQIVADNQLEQPYNLKVGQVLLIKISKH